MLSGADVDDEMRCRRASYGGAESDTGASFGEKSTMDYYCEEAWACLTVRLSKPGNKAVVYNVRHTADEV